ncbi:MAG: hypothetical protein JSU96_01680 [Acidobacteriota bacterium]|nr:MAG: hypothetical protein JSU96_01680 [Acidobacteriota bacterium]
MRPIALLLSALLLLTAGLGVYFTLSQPDPITFVPADTPALILVNRLPSSLNFVERTRFAGLVDLDTGELQARLNEAFSGIGLEALRDNVSRAWLCIQGLEAKESGSFRINFSAVIEPAGFTDSELRTQIEQAVRKAFGEQKIRVNRQDETAIFEGPEPGQLLYTGTREGYLLLANNVAGWRDLELTLSGHHASIANNEVFQRVTARVNPEMDLFVYVSQELAPGIIPGFAYGVTIVGEQVTESYAEVEE